MMAIPALTFGQSRYVNNTSAM